MGAVKSFPGITTAPEQGGLPTLRGLLGILSVFLFAVLGRQKSVIKVMLGNSKLIGRRVEVLAQSTLLWEFTVS